MITDELREWAGEFTRAQWYGLSKRAIEIADRIDAEHRAALEKVAAVVDGCPLEARVSAIEHLLNHKGAE